MKFGYYNDPIKISYDYLNSKDNVQALKNGWDTLGKNDYEKLFKIFIEWESSLNEEKIVRLTNVFNNYLNSKNGRGNLSLSP